MVRLIVLSGLPGTGKSAIADGIGRALRLPVFSVDPIESAMLAAGIARSFESGLAAYQVAEGLADRSLATDLDAIVDAVNSVEPARNTWRALAAKHDATLLIIECGLPDRAIHEARLAGRQRGLALPEPSWDDVERRGAEWTPWPEPHLTLDALEPIEENLARTLDYVSDSKNSKSRNVNPPLG
jgi:predicted kinase